MPCWTLMIVTFAPTIAECDWSVTVPCSAVVPVWARTPLAATNKIAMLATTRTIKLRSINARKYMYCSFRAPFQVYRDKGGSMREGARRSHTDKRQRDARDS